MGKEDYEETAESLLEKLDSNLKIGLSSVEAQKRIQQYGYNVSAEEKKVSAIEILLRQFKSFIIYVLIFASLVSFVMGNRTEFFVITAIILFIILISFFEEYKATKEMEALKKLTPKKARVLRDDKEEEISADEIVPGDIIILKRGDIIPADARILKSSNLKVDESTITGESVAVSKIDSPIKGKAILSEQKNMVFASSPVINGSAFCVVVKTGRETEIGKISEMVKGVKVELTPLQKRLDKLGKQFSIVVLIICSFILIVGILRGQSWESMLLLAVAVAVSGIPESLPAVIGVALAIGVKRMAKQGAIIRRLPAVETLGTCTVICTDKTGTLTQNKMVIEKIFTFDSEINVTSSGLAPEGLFMREKEVIKPLKHRVLSKILEIGTLCNNSNLLKKDEEWCIEGDSTDGALIVLAKKAGIDKSDFHKKFPRIHEHPFDSERKCMSSVHMVMNKPIVYAKGAPEMLINKSSFYLKGGKIKKINEEIRKQILSKTEEYASKGLRVLGLAYKEHKGKTFELKHVESSLIFVGLVSMRDPPEESVYGSVKLCKEAGTKVVMITGDNEVTALSVAKELGIYEEGNEMLTGQRLDKMSEKEFMKIVEDVTVYARTTPRHKLRIVEVLQKKGHIVAMTGDGVNDAPALKKADIGVAMGRCGTEVAKEASEMILRDDNFSTIVSAIKEGRTIYSNIRKFIYYLLAGNFSEVIIIFIAAVIGILPPLTPLMILFINLVTSDFPAFGLCLEKPSENIMKQKPRDPKEGILSDYIFLKIGSVVPWIVLGTIALYMWELVVKQGTVPKAQTIAFTTLIVFELFHVFNAKSFNDAIFSKRIFSNPALFLGWFASVIFTLLVIYWGPAQKIFGTVALGLGEWFSIILISSVIIFFVEIQKTIISSEIKEREKMEIHPTRG